MGWSGLAAKAHPSPASKMFLAQALHRAAEAGTIPVAEAIARADVAFAAFDLKPSATSSASFVALRCVLSGDYQSALVAGRTAVEAAELRLSRADVLCTVAIAHAGLGQRREAQDALDQAKKLAPAYPRIKVAERHVADPVLVIHKQ
jgi:hypothetical protein